MDLQISLLFVVSISGLCVTGTYLTCYDCSQETCDNLSLDRTGKCQPRLGGKCFFRQDPNGLTYRGCADHKQWPNLDISYSGCKPQYYGWWDKTPVLWCLCDYDMCNTNETHLTSQYGGSAHAQYNQYAGSENSVRSRDRGVQYNYENSINNNINHISNMRPVEQSNINEYSYGLYNNEQTAIEGQYRKRTENSRQYNHIQNPVAKEGAVPDQIPNISNNIGYKYQSIGNNYNVDTSDQENNAKVPKSTDANLEIWTHLRKDGHHRHSAFDNTKYYSDGSVAYNYYHNGVKYPHHGRLLVLPAPSEDSDDNTTPRDGPITQPPTPNTPGARSTITVHPIPPYTTTPSSSNPPSTPDGKSGEDGNDADSPVFSLKEFYDFLIRTGQISPNMGSLSEEPRDGYHQQQAPSSRPEASVPGNPPTPNLVRVGFGRPTTPNAFYQRYQLGRTTAQEGYNRGLGGIFGRSESFYNGDVGSSVSGGRPANSFRSSVKYEGRPSDNNDLGDRSNFGGTSGGGSGNTVGVAGSSRRTAFGGGSRNADSSDRSGTYGGGNTNYGRGRNTGGGRNSGSIRGPDDRRRSGIVGGTFSGASGNSVEGQIPHRSDVYSGGRSFGTGSETVNAENQSESGNERPGVAIYVPEGADQAELDKLQEMLKFLGPNNYYFVRGNRESVISGNGVPVYPDSQTQSVVIPYISALDTNIIPNLPGMEIYRPGAAGVVGNNDGNLGGSRLGVRGTVIDRNSFNSDVGTGFKADVDVRGIGTGISGRGIGSSAGTGIGVQGQGAAADNDIGIGMGAGLGTGFRKRSGGRADAGVGTGVGTNAGTGIATGAGGGAGDSAGNGADGISATGGARETGSTGVAGGIGSARETIGIGSSGNSGTDSRAGASGRIGTGVGIGIGGAASSRFGTGRGVSAGSGVGTGADGAAGVSFGSGARGSVGVGIGTGQNVGTGSGTGASGSAGAGVGSASGGAASTSFGMGAGGTVGSGFGSGAAGSARIGARNGAGGASFGTATGGNSRSGIGVSGSVERDGAARVSGGSVASAGFGDGGFGNQIGNGAILTCKSLACDHFCEDRASKARCRCRRGFYLLDDGLTCKDENECDQQNGGCDHICTNTIGSYHCTCLSNGYRLANDAKTCLDKNECTSNNGGCSHFCENSEGTYRCYCPPGYELATDEHTCVDINECLQPADHNCQQVCTNVAGAYQCDCNNGYAINPHDLRTCDDIDECFLNLHDCDRNCYNSPGSYNCRCGDGYRLARNGRDCLDINECLVNMGGCTQRCVNIAGSYYCDCHAGFAVNADKRTCDDVNECGTGNGGCDQVCTNNNGSFVCSCSTGYLLDLDGFACRDINECQNQNGGCHHECQNILGSYRCSCLPGSTLNADRHSCDAQDPCSINNGGCDHTCTKTSVGRRCSCDTGYRLDTNGASCIDDNECLFNNGGCGHTCKNSLGSFACHCRGGFTLDPDGLTCNDIDECLLNNGGCAVNCRNSIGSYFCTCNRGFNLAADGRRCIDIDECLNQNAGCSHICTNVIGSYTCSCPDDLFRLDIDGKSCIATCPATFVQPRGLGSCYKVFTATEDARSVQEAEQVCNQEHNQASLVSIESEAEQQFLANRLRNEPEMLEGWQGWWTSGLYKGGRTQFQWGNGEGIEDNSPSWGFKKFPFKYTCVWVLQISVYNYTWGNYGCDTKSGFVCEINLPEVNSYVV